MPTANCGSAGIRALIAPLVIGTISGRCLCQFSSPGAPSLMSRAVLTSLDTLSSEAPAPSPHKSWEGRCPVGRWTRGTAWTLPLQVFSSERLQDKKTWVQAQGACQELGAQLLSLASYEEEHFVANMLNKIFGY